MFISRTTATAPHYGANSAAFPSLPNATQNEGLGHETPPELTAMFPPTDCGPLQDVPLNVKIPLLSTAAQKVLDTHETDQIDVLSSGDGADHPDPL